jgi:hypothetical protein
MLTETGGLAVSNQIVGLEIVEVDVDPAQVQLYLRVEAEQWTPTTEVRATLLGPRNALGPTAEVTHTFQPLKKPEPDVGPEIRTWRVLLPEPALWSPESPCRYEGTVELWQDGALADSHPLHYSLYNLAWSGGDILLNDEPLIPHLRRVDTLDEPAVHRLRAEKVNVVLLPASATGAWELADRLGLFLLGELSADGTLPDDLLDRSVRPCCLGWVFPTLETPLPGEVIPGLFGLCSPVPFDELPDGIDFLLLDAPPVIELTYPWIVGPVK